MRGVVGAGGEKPPAIRLGNKFVVFSMAANPNPLYSARCLNTYCSIMLSYPY